MARILVVDDEPFNRKLILEAYKGMADFDEAKDGQEAIEKYNQAIKDGTMYQIIILDLAMPVMDGFGVLGLIRENERKANVQLGQGVYIVVSTAFSYEYMKAFKMGCDEYILKPLDLDKLGSIITNALKKK